MDIGEESLENYDAGMNYLIIEYENFFDLVRKFKERIKAFYKILNYQLEYSDVLENDKKVNINQTFNM